MYLLILTIFWKKGGKLFKGGYHSRTSLKNPCIIQGRILINEIQYSNLTIEKYVKIEMRRQNDFGFIAKALLGK